MFCLNNSCDMHRADTGENGKSKIVYVELLTYKLVKGTSYSFISILNMDGCFFLFWLVWNVLDIVI